MTEKGHKLTLNVTDNQAVTPLKKYLRSKNCRWQFVEPANHRVNAAERAIQMFKNHFISGLCSTDIQWPTQLWDQLVNQAATTLNILRKSRVDKKKHSINSIATNTIGMHSQWPHQGHALSYTSAREDTHHGAPEVSTHGTEGHPLITTEIASSSSQIQYPTTSLAHLNSSHSTAYSQNSRQYNTQ